MKANMETNMQKYRYDIYENHILIYSCYSKNEAHNFMHQKIKEAELDMLDLNYELKKTRRCNDII